MTLHVPPERLFVGAHDRSELERGGVRANELRGPGWTRANQGLWSWTAGGPPDPAAHSRVLRAAPLVRDHGAIGGWAAGLLHGFAEFDGTCADGKHLPVPLCLPRAVRCRRPRDVRVFRSDLTADEIVVVDGVRVTSLVRTAADLVRRAGSDVEAVVNLDMLLRRHPTFGADVATWIHTHARHRGLPRARRVLDLARAGSASPQESRLRMMWVLDAGLQMPRINRWLYDADGRLLGCADLFDADAGLVGEYDGEHHADARQRTHDHRRRESMERAGLIVVQHTMIDLGAGREMAVDRLRRAHGLGLSRDRSRDRWYLGAAPDWAAAR